MPAVSSFMLAASVAGLGLSAKGTMDRADAEKDASAASKRAEDARKKQAALDYARQQRKIFRDAQAAQSVGLSNLTNASAQFGSGLGGMIGQTMGALGQQSLDVAQNAGIGNTIFQANADLADAQRRASTAAGWQGLGKDIFASAGAIGRVGNTIFGGPNADQGIHDWDKSTVVYKA